MRGAPVSFTCPCGPRDIIADGRDGLLVENGDIGGLAEKICYLIEHEDLRRKMGRQARVDVERFRNRAYRGAMERVVRGGFGKINR